MNKTPLRQLEQIKKYQNTPRGKAKRAFWLLINKDKISEYQKKYMKRRRANAKYTHTCPTCYKKPSTPTTQNCQTCREELNQRNQKRTRCKCSLSQIDINTGRVKCLTCNKTIQNPTGRAKTFSDIIKQYNESKTKR